MISPQWYMEVVVMMSDYFHGVGGLANHLQGVNIILHLIMQ